MPEYLSPGVYVEETSFRSKSIEGVPTSTTGFVGMTRTGPIQYPNGPSTSEPRLITSFTEFERTYGGLELLEVGPDAASVDGRLAYAAHAARAFFDNGGKRLYVSRVFGARTPPAPAPPDWGVATKAIAVGGATATWRARWPGAYGNVLVDVFAVRSKNLAYDNTVFGVRQVQQVKKGSVIEITTPPATPPVGNADLDPTKLAVVDVDAAGRQTYSRAGAPVALNAGDLAQLVELRVRVTRPDLSTDDYAELAGSNDPNQKRYIGRILERDDPADEDAVVWLDWDPTAPGAGDAVALMDALQGSYRLTGGHDGDMASPADIAGNEADPDDATKKATGLEALGEIDDIAIVAAPDSGTFATEDECFTAAQALISHAERERYRIAVVDGLEASSMSQIREYRGRFDTTYGALYHPWIKILDPTERAAQGAPPKQITLPPSGFVAGIYARSDIERGVYKAPANEIVRGLTRFEININRGRNDVLNPEGINALRFFPGRGNRVWGARTMTSDPEWKYVNVRRLFIYLEHSIDKATQWAVFEPNNERLWANIRQTIEDFLLVQWKGGALLGSKPEEAYFVRCDRTTMTQNDLDNGRLICLIGVAPTKPAEFVIFRIGQWTADSKVA